MKLVDLFCGAGGASVGYHRAGFEVVGVDLHPQKNYPFEFHQADALTFPLEGFDVIHASPPCQAYTSMSNRHRGKGGKADSHDELIETMRGRLQGHCYVIENVVGAARSMPSPMLLHGGMFGLGVYRPRLFESTDLLWSFQKTAPPTNPVGVYGKLDGRRLWTRSDGTEQRCAASLEEAQAAMGIDWMDWRELCEAIPPAYTEWIGLQLIEGLRAAA